jgi:protein-disulfide isomerase
MIETFLRSPLRIAMSVFRHLLAAAIGLSSVVAVSAQDLPGTIAEVNGKPILAADVDAKLGNNLAKLQQDIYELRQKQIESLIDQQLLEEEAGRQGIPVATLVNNEITARVSLATGAEAQKFYDDNKAQLQGQQFAALQDQIKNFLTSQRLQARQQEYIASLRAKAKIEVRLPKPPIYRSEVVTTGAPVRGNPDAPVTIVEFSDFHCPFCRRVQPAVSQVLAKYGDKVKLVYRDFPLDQLHPQARAAAEASRCAQEQGKFWEFHDVLFRNDPDATAPTLNKLAKEAGLDAAAFETCRASGKYKQPVQASSVEGARLGITGTPTFFVNGRILVGAQPLEEFSKIIDDELAAAGKPASGR